MNMPLAGSKLSESARRYVARISSLYDRAKALVAGHPSEDNTAPLQAWEWHRVSAEACVEEAVLMYVEGLESLLKRRVTVTPEPEAGLEAPPAQFLCRVHGRDEAGADRAGTSPETGDDPQPDLSFRLGQAVLMDSEPERQAVEALFGTTAPELLEAFAHGVWALKRLGNFDRQAALTLQPDDVPAAVVQAVADAAQQA